MKYPGRAQLLDICGIDFPQGAVAAPGVVAVVGGPIRSDRTRQQVFRALQRTETAECSCPVKWRPNQHGKKPNNVTRCIFISANFPCPDWKFLKCASIQSALIFQM